MVLWLNNLMFPFLFLMIGDVYNVGIRSFFPFREGERESEKCILALSIVYIYLGLMKLKSLKWHL